MSIISFEELQQHFGGSSAAEVVVRLKNSRIKYFIGKRNKPFTTLAALNSALGLHQNEIVDFKYTDSPDEIEVL
jgi:hypothetical protein